MTKAIKIRALVDFEDDDIFRDIVILDDQTFEDLHLTIQDAFGFDNQHMASFYKSSDAWDRGDEITLMAMDEGKTPIMSETLLCDHITHAGQKLIYVFDFLLMWCFFVEVVSVGGLEDGQGYPDVVLTHGKSPNQYDKEIPIMSSMEIPGGGGMPDMEDGNVSDFGSLFEGFDDPTRFN